MSWHGGLAMAVARQAHQINGMTQRCEQCGQDALRIYTEGSSCQSAEVNGFVIDDPADRIEVIMHMLKVLERPSRPLSSWELDFLGSISTQFERNGSLSEKQFIHLERVYAEKAE